MKNVLFSIVSILVVLSVFLPCSIVSAAADTVLLGDVDGDKALTAVDSLMILRYSVKLDKLSKNQVTLADINGDNNVDASDALIVLRASVGLASDDLQSSGTAADYSVILLNYINDERAKVNAEPLTLDKTLCEISNKRAEEISRKNSFSHTRPNGSSWQTMHDEYNVCWHHNGEDIGAVPTAEYVFDLWMKSDGHRENMLSKDFKKLGVGYYFNDNSEYGHYWVLDFTD